MVGRPPSYGLHVPIAAMKQLKKTEDENLSTEKSQGVQEEATNFTEEKSRIVISHHRPNT